MSEEDKIHINSFKFYDRDELEDLTKKYYLENKKLKYELEQCKTVAHTNIELAESYHKEIERLKRLLKYDYEDGQSIMAELTAENQQLKADYGNKAQVERDLLLEEKQDLINYLKEKKEEYIKLYNISCDIIGFDRYECLKILCEEILSKIGENDK